MNSLQKALKKVASKRVTDLENWHQDSLDLFSRHLTDHERGVIAKCFQGGMKFMIGAIQEAGGVISLTSEDAIFIAEVLNILQKTPRPPHSRFVSRYVYIPNALSIMSSAPGSAPFPPQVGSTLPHMLPFASTLREGFAMYWTNRSNVLKEDVAAPCCVLRIRVPRGTPSFFWGPTAVPKPEAVERMSRALFDKKMNEFEVLLPPANLRVVKIHHRDLKKTVEALPEYTHHVPDLTEVANAFPNVPIYECELEPIDLAFFVTDSQQTAANILATTTDRLKGMTLLVSKQHVRPEVLMRMQEAVAARKAKWVPLIAPGRGSTPVSIKESRMDPNSLIFDDRVNYTKLQRHLGRIIEVMRVFNKYNPKTLAPYATEDAEQALAERDTHKLRKIIGGFWSDLTNSYDGFQKYFYDTVMDDLMTEVYLRIDDWLDDIDQYEFELEIDLTILTKMSVNNLMFKDVFDELEPMAQSYTSWVAFARDYPDFLRSTLAKFWKRLKAFDKDLRSAKRYLVLERLHQFRYSFRVRLNNIQCNGLTDTEIDRVEAAKQVFVRQMAPLMEPYTSKHNVLGVSFVPLHDGAIALGKEKGGVYKNKYNYFGGKILDKADKATAHTVAEVLFEECYEEIGIILEPSMFQKSLTKILVTPFKTQGVSLILVAKIRDLTSAWWRSIFVNRTDEECDWKYREMSKVNLFKISAIEKGSFDALLSDYVKNTAHLLLSPPSSPTPNKRTRTHSPGTPTPAPSVSRKSPSSPVSIRKFATLSIRNQTHQQLSP